MKNVFVKNMDFKKLPDEVCAAIGNFDGVHLGHQKLIEECKKHNYKSAVLTFYPHPSTLLKKIPNYPLVTPIEKKIEIVESMGIDYLIVIDFNEDIMNMSKEDFIQAMKKMGIKSCVCGYDFTFAQYAEGTIKDLDENFEFYEIKKFIYENVRVSTTYIRELISMGDVLEASKMLGRTFSIKGDVIHGFKNGRKLGFPTANVNYTNYFLPQNGVYFVKVLIDKELYDGMCNIGHNPTVKFQEDRRMEVNIFNFDKDIYGKKIEVFFKNRIRGEIKFSSLDELKAQLNEDRNKCMALSKLEKNQNLIDLNKNKFVVD